MTFPLGGLSSSFNQTLLSHICSTILPCTLTFKEFINWMKIRKTKSQARWHLSDAVWHIIVPTSTTHVASLASSSLNIFFRFNSSHLISSNLILNSSINPSVTYLSNMLLSANQTQQNSSSFNILNFIQFLPSKPNHIITQYFIVSLIQLNKNHYSHDQTLTYHTINSWYHKCIIYPFVLFMVVLIVLPFLSIFFIVLPWIHSHNCLQNS